MGLRGPQKTLKLSLSEKADLCPPEWLHGDYAIAFWNKHCKWCATNGLLTAQTVENFAICCNLWQKLQTETNALTPKQYLDLVHQFRIQSKLFRLGPTDKPGEPTTRHDDKETFNF